MSSSPARALLAVLSLAATAAPASGAESAPAPAPAPAPASPRIVINEVMYHPPDDRDDLQWIELHNPGPAAVDVSGWKLTQGVAFTFTNETRIAAGGFLVVTRDRGAFRLRYGKDVPSIGDFRGRLRHGGEQLQLVDRQGTVVDRARYDDREPWPTSPDGHSSSLERILPTGPGEDPSNWAPSPLPATARAAGSPGKPNVALRTNLPPVVSGVHWTPSAPGQPTVVTATIADPDGVKSARLLYQVWSVNEIPRGGPAPTPPEKSIPLNRGDGNPTSGVWNGTIPALEAGRLLRFRIAAVDVLGGERYAPHPDDARPTWSEWIGSGTNTALIPAVQLLQFGPAESPGASLRSGGPAPGRRDRGTGEPARGNGAAIYQPPGAARAEVFDYIRITPRQGGWKVRMQKDRPLDRMATVNAIFEFQPRFVLSEFLSYELYRAAGVPTPRSGHWRVSYNGRPLGYHLIVEQPNTSFLRQNGRDPDGELFKLLWYGGDVIGQHEKKNRPDTGHASIVSAIDSLNHLTGAAQWKYISEHFAVDECASYYAVNMCLQNWDGFFNNYFAYRSPGPAGKWEIIPWDEDKTWGDYDGASPQYDWYSMPLTMGMGGDQPKQSLATRFLGGMGGSGPFGGPQWWRPPGWFSGPLLANPTFRARFMTRLKELCETVFTPEKLEPIIAGLEQRLEPEVRYRAQMVGRGRNAEIAIPTFVDPNGSEAPSPNVQTALEQFKRHIGSFRRQVQHRREFILQELARGK